MSVIYDVSGRVIDNLVSDYKSEGSHEVLWNASSMPSGIYFARLNVNVFVNTQKLMLIK
ncbi:MAG: hypothetical protein CMG50_01090 [Candidatus Marinimicrobia bacterium]|nr:hypothetical protein [Candidatus Neomarinimicrobiota bacterium]